MQSIGRDGEHVRALLARTEFECFRFAQRIADPEYRFAAFCRCIKIAIGVPHDPVGARIFAQIDACHARKVGRAEDIHRLPAVTGQRDMLLVGRCRQLVRIGTAVDGLHRLAAGKVHFRQRVAELARNEQRAFGIGSWR